MSSLSYILLPLVALVAFLQLSVAAPANEQKSAVPAAGGASAPVLVSQAALEEDAEEDAEAAEERSRLLRENAALRKLAHQLYQTLENTQEALEQRVRYGSERVHVDRRAFHALRG